MIPDVGSSRPAPGLMPDRVYILPRAPLSGPPIHSFVASRRGRVKPGASGAPVPGYDGRVVDDSRREVPPGEPGLVAIKGSTGDADGYFTYHCRSDDMIISGGYKIPGPEVEQVLDEHGAVAESAMVVAFVVLRESYRAAPDLVRELQEHVKRERAPYNYPRAVEFIERLPRTETGEIQRYILRKADVVPSDPHDPAR